MWIFKISNINPDGPHNLTTFSVTTIGRLIKIYVNQTLAIAPVTEASKKLWPKILQKEFYKTWPTYFMYLMIQRTLYKINFGDFLSQLGK